MFRLAIGFTTDDSTARIVDPAGTHSPSLSPAEAVTAESSGPVVDVPQVSVAIVCAFVLLEPSPQSRPAAPPPTCCRLRS